jgi:hypothetical protein
VIKDCTNLYNYLSQASPLNETEPINWIDFKSANVIVEPLNEALKGKLILLHTFNSIYFHSLIYTGYISFIFHKNIFSEDSRLLLKTTLKLTFTPSSRHFKPHHQWETCVKGSISMAGGALHWRRPLLRWLLDLIHCCSHRRPLHHWVKH